MFIFAGSAPVLFFFGILRAHAALEGSSVAPSSPGEVIRNFFFFTLFGSGFLALGAIVWGAIKYTAAAGNPSAQKDGKEWITEALKGLLLLFGAVILLRTINPDLLDLNILKFAELEGRKITGVNPPGSICTFMSQQPGCGIFTAPCNVPPRNTSACTYENLGPQTCQPLVSGDASVDALRRAGCFNGNERKASGIARAESGGVATKGSATDKCLGDSAVVSWGLFQINISANRIGGLNCPRAFSAPYSGSKKNCRVVDRQLYTRCVDAAKNTRFNIEAACRISKGGTKWSAWGANSKCGF